MGLCVSFDWPSYGNVLGYYPDRAHARSCANDLTVVLSILYDYLLDKQAAAIKNPDNGCKAKVSVISHSMGNYVLQKAMAAAWTRKNQPLLVSLNVSKSTRWSWIRGMERVGRLWKKFS